MSFKQSKYELDSYKLDYQKDNIEYKSHYLEKLNTNIKVEDTNKKTSLITLILKRIEHYQEKLVLEKIKEILINESRKDYYKNAANVKELVELEKKDYIDKYGQVYLETKSMLIYYNGFYEFFTIRRLKYSVKELKK